jgi:hypothetical protein
MLRAIVAATLLLSLAGCMADRKTDTPRQRARQLLMIRLLAAMVLALSTKLAFAQGNVPGDRVYVLHSEAQGSCPSLNWHIVLRPDGVISGTFGSDNPKMVAMVAGSIDPQVQVDRYANPQASNQQDRTFSMIATELGTGYRVANITGTIDPNGWLSANVQGGPGVACKNIKVPLFVSPSPR